MKGLESIPGPYQLLGAVPRPHTKQARFLSSADGRSWVAKPMRTIRRTGLLAEAVAVPLASVLKVGVPDAGIVELNGDYWWCSCLEAEGDPWRPSDSSQLSGRDAARLVLLDLLLGNPDRHFENFLVLRRSGVAELRAIDHEESWIGRGAALKYGSPAVDEKYPLEFIDVSVGEESIREMRRVATILEVSAWSWTESLGRSLHTPPFTQSEARDVVDLLRFQANRLPKMVNGYIMRNRRVS